jgi:hypothetical protein
MVKTNLKKKEIPLRHPRNLLQNYLASKKMGYILFSYIISISCSILAALNRGIL